MSKLLIIGAGGLGRMIGEVAEAQGCFEKIDFAKVFKVIKQNVFKFV